jgi:hypothetical protein
MVRNSSTILDKSEHNRHPCLILYFRINGFSFSQFSMMLAIGLSYVAYSLTMINVEVNSFHSYINIK